MMGERVKELRKKLGWKQVTLARESGMTQATVSRIESDKVAQPKITHLKKLADALGVSLDYLAGNSVQLSFDDLLRDRQAQVVFRGWGKLSPAERKQLADLVEFFEAREREERGETER